MNETIPYTPFSTSLSRSARETELRLRSILSSPKKRPPALFLALVFAMCIFCGNLVSCNVVEADQPEVSQPEGTSLADSSQSVTLSGSEGTPQADSWKRVHLESSITPSCDWATPTGFLTEEQMALLDELPVDELPRDAVDLSKARREDYWRDMLLPVAYHEEEDVTVYFVVGPNSMPDIEPGDSPDLYSMDRDGIVLRHGDRAAYCYLSWDVNAQRCAPPPLWVNDFDGDGRPEAAITLAWGEGTGCFCQCLYIFDLDTMMYAVPDYKILPLRITSSPDGKKARLTSGDLEMMVDLTRLAEPFQGAAEVGNQVRFVLEDDQLICDLYLDFSSRSLEYLASVHFPVIYEGGLYKLGPAVWMGDIL